MSRPLQLAVAERIERRLACEIIRGERAPGSQLPPVRELARHHAVTPPTIQRVIDRLAAGGLVQARRGSGVTVCDPRRSGDLALLPLWFEALADQPARAAAILADVLELRRVVGAHLVRSAAPRLARQAHRLAELTAAAAAAATVPARAEADLALTAAALDAAGQFAVAAVFHTTARLVREVPHVAEALYGDAAHYRRVLARIAIALATPRGDPAALIAVLEAWDRRAVARYRALVSSSLANTDAGSIA
jgi:DNA-binding FadR family transcriptional regulator